MKKVLSVGYSQQIYYRNLPIGEPQRVVTHIESTWDEAKVDRVFALAAEAARC